MKPSKGKKGVITWQAMKINKQRNIWNIMMEYHDGIYFGIGCVLGTLCHTLFTFRWGEIHYIMFFAAILATIYSLIQTHRRNSYAPYRDKKIEGFDIFCILLGIVLTILVIYKIRLY